jgi:hypothetical protein
LGVQTPPNSRGRRRRYFQAPGGKKKKKKSGPDKTRVLAQSVFTPAKLSAYVLGPILRRKFHQIQRIILASLKQYVEDAVPR